MRMTGGRVLLPPALWEALGSARRGKGVQDVPLQPLHLPGALAICGREAISGGNVEPPEGPGNLRGRHATARKRPPLLRKACTLDLQRREDLLSDERAAARLPGNRAQRGVGARASR